MLDKILSVGLDVFAFVLPISIIAVSFFQLTRCTSCGDKNGSHKVSRTFSLAPGISISAFVRNRPGSQFKEIKNKDLYIVISIFYCGARS